jgi:hypothetical protein
MRQPMISAKEVVVRAEEPFENKKIGLLERTPAQ